MLAERSRNRSRLPLGFDVGLERLHALEGLCDALRFLLGCRELGHDAVARPVSGDVDVELSASLGERIEDLLALGESTFRLFLSFGLERALSGRVVSCPSRKLRPGLAEVFTIGARWAERREPIAGFFECLPCAAFLVGETIEVCVSFRLGLLCSARSLGLLQKALFGILDRFQ